MGNSLGGKRTAKIMKINGETMKLKTPAVAGEVIKDHPGLVLLDSEAVKHFGIRAKPLEPWQELKQGRLYFLVELPKFPEERGARRVRSGINMSAKDRLESLMLARRSVSDLSIMTSGGGSISEVRELGDRGENEGTRVKMRLRKADVERLMAESKDEEEAAERIVGLCLGNKAAEGLSDGRLAHPQVHCDGGRSRAKGILKGGKKRVDILPVNGVDIELAIAS